MEVPWEEAGKAIAYLLAGAGGAHAAARKRGVKDTRNTGEDTTMAAIAELRTDVKNVGKQIGKLSDSQVASMRELRETLKEHQQQTLSAYDRMLAIVDKVIGD